MESYPRCLVSKCLDPRTILSHLWPSTGEHKGAGGCTVDVRGLCPVSPVADTRPLAAWRSGVWWRRCSAHTCGRDWFRIKLAMQQKMSLCTVRCLLFSSLLWSWPVSVYVYCLSLPSVADWIEDHILFSVRNVWTPSLQASSRLCGSRCDNLAGDFNDQHALFFYFIVLCVTFYFVVHSVHLCE